MAEPAAPQEKSEPGVIARYAASRYFRHILGLVLFVLRPKLLSPEHYGIWTLLRIIPNYSSFVDLGGQTAMRYRVPQCRARGDKEQIRAVEDTVFSSSHFLAGLLGLALMALCFFQKDSRELQVGLAVMGLVVLLHCYYEFLHSWLKAHERFDIATAANYFHVTASFVLTVPLLYFFRLPGVFVAFALSYLAVILFMRWKIHPDHHLHFQKGLYLQLVRQGLPIVAANLTIVLLRSTDKFIVQIFMGSEYLGYYGIAATLFTFLVQAPGSAREVLEPKLMRHQEQEDPQALLRRFFLHPLCHTAFIMPVFLGPAFFLLGPFIRFVLPRYADAVLPSQVLLWGAYFLALSFVPRMTIIARGWQTRTLWFTPLALALNIGLSLLFLRMGTGLAGVALGSTLAYFVFFYAQSLFLQEKVGHIGAEWKRHWRAALAGLFLVVSGCFGLEALLLKMPWHPWVQSGVGAGFSGLAFLGLYQLAKKKLPAMQKKGYGET